MNLIQEPFHAVLPWRTLIPPPLFIQLLERAFFHKWLHTLYRWLTVPNKTPAFFDEVSKWYTEWKSLFPADLRTQPAIQAQFTVALNMMVRLPFIHGFIDFRFTFDSHNNIMLIMNFRTRP